MSDSRSAGFYRLLLRCYPRWFREEYGADMALLLADQLRDEPAARVWSRTVLDLAISLPARHLEAHMHRPPTTAVPIAYATVGITGLVFAAIVGTSPGLAALGLVIAVVGSILALTSWRATRAVTGARPVTAHWWKLLLGGGTVLATTIVAVNVTGEVPEGWWAPMMLTLLSAVLVTAVGLILGLVQLVSGRSHPAVT